MIRDCDACLGDVVAVIGFWKLMTEALCVAEPTHILGIYRIRDKRRIHRHSKSVIAGRDHGLAVATIEHEVLPAQKPNVFVRPAGTDTLIPWYTDASTNAKLGL